MPFSYLSKMQQESSSTEWISINERNYVSQRPVHHTYTKVIAQTELTVTFFNHDGRGSREKWPCCRKVNSGKIKMVIDCFFQRWQGRREADIHKDKFLNISQEESEEVNVAQVSTHKFKYHSTACFFHPQTFHPIMGFFSLSLLLQFLAHLALSFYIPGSFPRHLNFSYISHPNNLFPPCPLNLNAQQNRGPLR